ncbi:tetratricopeptide (TPR) repeat protein [Pontibacter aydingkolensis]|uniref:Tetratricopeptide repeat protein n=1 Tax=Pontibacter aydingkolensis TaxID=1911536 RepID=A0ABS7CZB9_9BACT|nr:tetratricopeptide repeat protein [Pontibacter aydingkolensis]MBW7469194.1 tetratricopeptide repeat protein [Pontibacter aydingkolensis]
MKLSGTNMGSRLSITTNLLLQYLLKFPEKAVLRVLGISIVLLVCSAAVPGGEAKYIRRADVAFDLENYTLALELYSKALEINPKNLKANYKAGYCYMELHEPKKAKVYFKKAFDITPTFSDYLILLYLAEAHHQDYDFKEARQYYQQEMSRTPRTDRPYIQFLQKRIDECAAGAILVNKPSVAEVVNLGRSINTSYSDYIPVFMPGDSTMLFTTRYRYPDKNGLLTDEEKLKYARLGANGWEETILAYGTFKNRNGHGLVNIGPHGKKLYTFHTTKGLHVSELEQGAWGEPQQLGYPFNEGKLNVSIFITPDRKYAFFSSDRAGGLGGLDLYVTARQQDGSWGPALNLGPNINTAFDDDAPFVDPVTHTLYFSSLGHNNMGGFDIFSSRLENGEWSAAQNLGYPINSTHDDLYFVLNRNRTNAFLSSNRAGGFGGKDIYQVLFPVD